MSYLGSRAKSYLPLTADVVELTIRQQPEQAVVTPQNKEKMRKPVDPPPIIQLFVDASHDGGSGNFLVNPFVFMTVTLVGINAPDDGNRGPARPQLLGTLVSSLHRLKDIDNKDGGFFVFGDISCREEGTFKLQFDLFELRNEMSHLIKTTFSHAFRVLPTKDFKGLKESTHLSRTFSDQGVKLRLRKEPRTLGKRSHDRSPPNTGTASQYGASYPQSVRAPSMDDNGYGYGGQVKRQRADSDGSPQLYANSSFLGGPVSQYTPNTFSSYPSSAYFGDSSTISMPPQTQTQTVQVPPIPAWQRPYMTGSIGSQGTGMTLSRPPGDLFAEQRTPQYHMRSSTDFTAAFGLQTPTTGSDSSLPGYNYGPPSNETAGSIGRSGEMQSMVPSLHMGAQHVGAQHMASEHVGNAQHAGPQDMDHQPFSAQSLGIQHLGAQHGGAQPVRAHNVRAPRVDLQHMDAQNLGAQHAGPQHAHVQGPTFGLPANPLTQAGQTFAPIHHDISPLSYPSNTQSSVKTESDHFSGIHHVDSARESYGGPGPSLPQPSLTLNTGVLNRGFAPSHPPQPDHDPNTYKPQSSYPTPNQTSPSG